MDEERWSACQNVAPGGVRLDCALRVGWARREETHARPPHAGWLPVLRVRGGGAHAAATDEEGEGASTPSPREREPGGELVAQSMRWGLVPFYTKPGDTIDFYRMVSWRSGGGGGGQAQPHRAPCLPCCRPRCATATARVIQRSARSHQPPPRTHPPTHPPPHTPHAALAQFNARSETVTEKPAFRRLVPSKRCVVLVDAFYEWAKEVDGTKQPWQVQLASGEPLAFAGLYDCLRDAPDGQPMYTCTILTTGEEAARGGAGGGGGGARGGGGGGGGGGGRHAGVSR